MAEAVYISDSEIESQVKKAGLQFSASPTCQSKLIGIDVLIDRVVAARDIKRGENVCLDVPIFSYNYGSDSLALVVSLQVHEKTSPQWPQFMKVLERAKLHPRDPEEMKRSIIRFYPGMSEEMKAAVLDALPYKIDAVARLNQFVEGSVNYVYESASKFNHSCYPNCFVQFAKQMIIINTCRDVKKGEELTISYYGEKDEQFFKCGSIRERRAYIIKKHYFLCSCLACDGKLLQSPSDWHREVNDWLTQIVKSGEGKLLTLHE